VSVHAGTRLVQQGLGHERGVQPLLEGDLLHDQAEGHQVVRGRQGVGVAQVDLLLPGTALVVAELDGDPHLLEQGDRIAPEVVRRALRAVVEVPVAVDRDRLHARLRGVLEQVELDLRVRVEREAELSRLGEGAPQDEPRVRVGRRAVGHQDVAEQPGDSRPLTAPRQQREGRRVGLGQHVGLVDAGETLDRGAVEADPLGERTLELRRRDRHGLEHAQDVGEPQSDEPDVALLDRAQHELRLLVHGVILLAPVFHECYTHPCHRCDGTPLGGVPPAAQVGSGPCPTGRCESPWRRSTPSSATSTGTPD
jgi:hypothetical protein